MAEDYLNYLALATATISTVDFVVLEIAITATEAGVAVMEIVTIPATVTVRVARADFVAAARTVIASDEIALAAAVVVEAEVAHSAVRDRMDSKAE